MKLGTSWSKDGEHHSYICQITLAIEFQLLHVIPKYNNVVFCSWRKTNNVNFVQQSKHSIHFRCKMDWFETECLNYAWILPDHVILYVRQVLTKDSVTVSVDAVVYYRVSNATVSVANVENAHHSTRLLAQTTLRNVLGTKNLSEILSERESISNSMQVYAVFFLFYVLHVVFNFTSKL